MSTLQQVCQPWNHGYITCMLLKLCLEFDFHSSTPTVVYVFFYASRLEGEEGEEVELCLNVTSLQSSTLSDFNVNITVSLGISNGTASESKATDISQAWHTCTHGRRGLLCLCVCVCMCVYVCACMGMCM